MKKGFITVIATFALVLSGCNLFGGGSDSQSKDDIKSFEFVTDSTLTIEDSVYVLTMYVGDTYQLKTNIDDKLDDKYHFTYESVDEPKYTISSTGLVSAAEKCVETFGVRLIRNSDSKKLAYKSLVINIKEPSQEYANITLSDSTLEYDESTRTYSLSIKGGNEYRITTSIKSNVAYTRSFELSNSEYSSFMAVDASGRVTTQEVSEDKNGQVTIKTKSMDNSRVYDTVYLNVHVEKNDVVVNDLVVTNLSSGAKVNDGDKLSLYVEESLTFGIKYGEDNKYGVMSVSNSDVLTLENNLNKVTAASVGKSNVTFAYEDKSITIEIEAKKNTLAEIYSKNGSDDFAIINGQLFYLGRMFASFASGLELDITKSENLTYVIANKSLTHKNVTFSYTSEGVTKTVSYDVKYFETKEYTSTATAYNLSDYFDNRYRGGYYVLPNEGEIHMLVIPVWFTNSTSFFREDQKQEILDDLEYVYNSTRNKDDYYSVKQFYETESGGKLTLTITISDFYTSGTSSLDYGDTAEADINRTHTLADNAIQWYFANNTSESISDYDSNGDNLVDAVSLVYAANYYGRIGDANGTDAFQFKNNGGTHKYNNGSLSPLGGVYGFFKTGNKYGKDVQDLSTYYPSYFFKSGGKTIIHETGHMFGMADLYEDNHATTKYYPAGKFSMQSSNYGTHDPYQMNLVGWSKPQIYSASDYEVGDTVTLKIDDFATSGNNIILSREWNSANSLFDEYMLLELFAPTGLNYFEATNSTTLGFSDAGIRLWHINSILENMSDGGKETNEITGSNLINLKYSNNNQSSPCDLAHWIRNNVEEPYDTVSTVHNNYGLFKAGDSFDMDSYSSQFINAGKLDNKEKLGWEFTVDSIYQTIDDAYGAIITLTRTENTRTDFDVSTRLDKDIATQPAEDGNDYALEFLGNNDLFSLVYNFNDATAPSYYTQGKPISYKGMCLFAEPNGNGGSLVITIKDKDGYKVSINSVSVTCTMLTKASITALVNGDEVTGTPFTGPYNDKDGYNEKGMTYVVNSKSITLQNKYVDGVDYWSVLALYSISINYHVEKN